MAVKTVPGLISHVPLKIYSFLVTPLYVPSVLIRFLHYVTKLYLVSSVYSEWCSKARVQTRDLIYEYVDNTFNCFFFFNVIGQL